MDRVVINPSDVIRMPVLPLQACETKLRIDNNSDTAITYKVKTTQPKRYYVRPNQGVIAAHSSDEISIILVDKEVPDLLVSASEGIPDDSKDRFLVMYAPIDNEQYQRCAQVTSDADGGATGDERRVKEVASLWAPKEPASKVSKRLNVELRLPADLHAAVMQMEQGGKRDAVMDARNRIRGVEGREDHQSSSAAPMEQPPQLGEVQQSSKSPASSTTSTSTPHRGGAASNGQQQQQQQQASSSSSAAAPREKSSRRHHDDNKHSREGGAGGGDQNLESLYQDLVSTRKKYDALVEYTVKLTAERDLLTTMFQNQKTEFEKLKNKHATLAAASAAAEGGGGAGGKAAAAAAKAQQGGPKLSTLHLVMVALLFFLLGKFLRAV